MRLTAGRAAGRAGKVLAVGLAAVLCVTACRGDGESDSAEPASRSIKTLSEFDLVVVASAENNPLFSDVYGITLDPLSATRITMDKRISSIDADGERVVVAAADGPHDRLALVGADGELREVPGLGRPFASSPNLLAGGSVVFRDFVQPDGTRVFRTRMWDAAATDRTKTLSRSADELFGLQVGPDGRELYVRNRATGDDDVVVLTRTGKKRSYRLDGDGAGFLGWGRDFIAATANAAEASFGESATGTVFLHIATGDRRTVPGWQPIAWNLEGTRLLVRSTADLAQSELAWLDPRNVDAVERLGEIPDLAIYFGTWMRDDG